MAVPPSGEAKSPYTTKQTQGSAQTHIRYADKFRRATQPRGWERAFPTHCCAHRHRRRDLYRLASNIADFSGAEAEWRARRINPHVPEVSEARACVPGLGVRWIEGEGGLATFRLVANYISRTTYAQFKHMYFRYG